MRYNKIVLRTLIALFSVFLISGCSYFTKEKDEEIERLKNEKMNLQKQSTKNDSTINAFIKSFNEIEGNLTTIKERESIISGSTDINGEFEMNVANRIIRDINLIDELMLENKRKLSYLKGQINNVRRSNNNNNSGGIKIAELEKTISILQKQLTSKDEEIMRLKDQLASLSIEIKDLNFKLDTISSASKQKDIVIAEQETKLNKAYYLFGTTKELKKYDIIIKKGGFIGIGKTKQLTDKVNKKHFTEINIQETISIPLSCKKAELLSIHPKGSYKFKGGKVIEKFEITDTEKFWSASKYLVILVK